MDEVKFKEAQRKRLVELYAQANATIKNAILSNEIPSKEVDISIAYERSARPFVNYVTLDLKHRDEIINIVSTIKSYAEDRTRKRPLNIIMQAEPGSGKSLLVKCIARHVRFDVTAVDFNMASLQNIEDLVQPLDMVRNQKVIDKLPILFLDEFDSNPDHYPLLLPLLWDGELHIGHRDLKMGKLVVILAGSGSKIEEMMKTAKGMHPTETPRDSKLVDLLSRINGGEIGIPPLDMVKNNRDRRVDKVCITIALLEQRFQKRFETVPWALLRFVALAQFRYGVRSITHLIDLLENPGDEEQSNLKLQHLTLPLESVTSLKESSLAYHLVDEDGPAAIVEKWKKVKITDIPIRIREHEDEVPF